MPFGSLKPDSSDQPAQIFRYLIREVLVIQKSTKFNAKKRGTVDLKLIEA